MDSRLSVRGRVAKTALVLSLVTFFAKAAGLLRSALIAGAYGMTEAAVAFESASKLPSLLFDFLIGSVITCALIPVFNE
ncbi:MAG: hypothetical protein II797_04515, partial [Clostridia bacterium]|nr:hypothetical protein [Clostridia bacterium]